MIIEENGTLSIEIKYKPETHTFMTSIICGHLQEKEKKNIFEFSLPLGRIREKVQELEKDNKAFSLFDYVYFEGSSLEVYYFGFSNGDSSIITREKGT